MLLKIRYLLLCVTYSWIRISVLLRQNIVQECSKADNMTKLDDEVDKFHEVVIKNQTSVTNFLEVGKGMII